MKKTLFILLAFLIAASSVNYAQVTAVINLEAYSPVEVAHGIGIDTSKYHSPSNGLPVVGVGEMTYLKGMDSKGAAVTTYAWTLTKPNGSTSTLENVDQVLTTLRTDMVGTYQVGLTITTATGTGTTSINITSAKYVGVGGIGGLGTDVMKGQCGLCHADNTAEWKQTGHATMFELAVDGLKSNHYGEACVECHTVGYDKDVEAVNDGFDDIQTSTGWIFPTPPAVGQWANIVTSYPTLAHRSNIQCENCHGAGSEHKGDKTKIAISLDEGMCGKCHEEEPYHIKNTQYKNSLHSVGVTSASTRTGCADCHSGYGFIARIDPESNLSQKTGSAPTSCAVCHDPHSNGTGVHQVRTLANVELANGDVLQFGGNARICMQCHKGRQNAEVYVVTSAGSSHFGPHYCNQSDMLAGANAITFGRYIPSSTHRNALANACVDCHMAATPAAGNPGHNEVGEHTFAISANGVDNVAKCQTCHGPITKFSDIIARQDYDKDGTVESCEAEVEGLLEELGKLLPPIGDPAVVIDSKYDLMQKKAAFNYQFVEEDGSKGMHNFQYTVGLLKTTIEAMNYGILTEGYITGIKDVANDQGKQVHVSWSRFGGDGVSDDPVNQYGVFRKDNISAKANIDFASKSEIPNDLSKVQFGSTLKIGADVWTYVAYIPAVQSFEYSVVAPTLFDSTKTMGMKMSYFKVLGITRNGANVETRIDSGYSMDNLAPIVPLGFKAVYNGGPVDLSWEESVDADFNYFAIYRSTTSGFDVKEMQPYATTTDKKFSDANVISGQNYYYRLGTIDFSGNMSASNELLVSITSVKQEGGVPTNYELFQNYPNPFNPSTEIKFALPEASQVKITIYNAVGKEVETIVNENMAAGYYNYRWNAKNMSSGVYLYEIQTDKFRQTRKMMLLK